MKFFEFTLAFVLMMHSPWITACIRVPGILEAQCCSYTILKWQLVTSSVRRENMVILDILLQKYNLCGFIHAKHIHNKWSSSHWHLSWWCIHSGLAHASECWVLLFKAQCCLYAIFKFKWQLVASSVRRENMVILDILLQI